MEHVSILRRIARPDRRALPLIGYPSHLERWRWSVRMNEQEGVAAVDRALSILDALTDDRVSLAELSKRTGLYKSTVLRLMKSLEKGGYALRTSDGMYRLGAK